MKRKNNIIFIVCCVICVASIIAAIAYKASQSENQKVYEDLLQDVDREEQDAPSGDGEDESVEIPIDFESLQSKYPDAYAWIEIPDTEVNYPIVQSWTTDTKDYYLDHTIDGEAGLPGAIYTQYSLNNREMTDDVTVIYGHNMRDGSMFGCLNEYQNSEYREAHRDIYIYTPDHIYQYRVFCAVTYDARHILNHFNCNENEEGYQEFLTSLEEIRLMPKWIDESIEVTTEDQVIILSTCNENDDQRYLIGAVLVDEK